MEKLIPRVLSDSTPGGESGRVAENQGTEVVPFSNLLLVHFFFQFHTTSTVSKKLDVSVHQLVISSYQNKTKRSLEYNLERD